MGSDTIELENRWKDDFGSPNRSGFLPLTHATKKSSRKETLIYFLECGDFSSSYSATFSGGGEISSNRCQDVVAVIVVVNFNFLIAAAGTADAAAAAAGGGSGFGGVVPASGSKIFCLSSVRDCVPGK